MKRKFTSLIIYENVDQAKMLKVFPFKAAFKILSVTCRSSRKVTVIYVAAFCVIILVSCR